MYWAPDAAIDEVAVARCLELGGGVWSRVERERKVKVNNWERMGGMERAGVAAAAACAVRASANSVGVDDAPVRM